MQRTTSVDRSVVLIRLYLLICCIYGASPLSTNKKQIPYRAPFISHRYLFFTNLSLWFTIFTSFVALFHRHVLNIYSFVNFAVTSSSIFNSIICSTFWPLYFIKRELIIGRSFIKNNCETYLLTELCIHLVPFILSVFEQYDIPLRKSKSVVVALILFAPSYLILLSYSKYHLGKFPYSFMNHISYGFVVLFLFGMCVYGFLWYLIIILLNNLMHGIKYSEVNEKEENKKIQG